MKTATPELIEKFEQVARETGRYENIIQEGIQRGIQKGIVKNKMEAAVALLDVLDDETISQKMQLPLTTVQKLRRRYSSSN